MVPFSSEDSVVAVLEMSLSGIQLKMLDVLSDGAVHEREELFLCLKDQRSKLKAIQYHISKIREVVRLRGEDIVCVIHKRRPAYRHIRLLRSPYDGKS